MRSSFGVHSLSDCFKTFGIYDVTTSHLISSSVAGTSQLLMSAWRTGCGTSFRRPIRRNEIWYYPGSAASEFARQEDKLEKRHSNRGCQWGNLKQTFRIHAKKKQMCFKWRYLRAQWQTNSLNHTDIHIGRSVNLIIETEKLKTVCELTDWEASVEITTASETGMSIYHEAYVDIYVQLSIHKHIYTEHTHKHIYTEHNIQVYNWAYVNMYNWANINIYRYTIEHL